MIDTGRYEGHTEGPWRFVEDYAEHDDPTFLIRANENEQLVYHQTGEWLPDKRVDWRLMADAPLLLEEVKQLQLTAGHLSSIIFDTELREQKLWEEKEELKAVLSEYEADPETTGGMLEDLRAEVERLREQKKSLTILFKLMNAGNWYEKYCTAIQWIEDWEDEEE